MDVVVREYKEKKKKEEEIQWPVSLEHPHQRREISSEGDFQFYDGKEMHFIITMSFTLRYPKATTYKPGNVH